MIDTDTRGAPGWWLKRLLTKLEERRPAYDLLDSHYRNEAGIPVPATKATRDAYRRLMALAQTNFAELVVEAVRERMQPEGFRTGREPDGAGDAEAWRIWQANALDADFGLITRAQLSLGDAYVIVGPVDPDIEAPVITPEDPRQVIAVHDPIRRRKAVAALKVFHDEEAGEERAYVYLPGVIHRAVRARAFGSTAPSSDWEWETDENGEALPELARDVVPVVRFANRPTMFGEGVGEYERHLSILNRINYGILNRLEITTLQAFRQRAIQGDFPTTDADGNEVDYDNIFAADPGALWLLPETAKLWESGQVDLGPIRAAIRDDVTDLAAVTRTPLFYLTADAANGSAEGASLAREGLVFKTGERIKQASEAGEQVMSLAFRMAGDEERAKRADLEVVWAPPERFSLAERYDAASKAIAAGVPWRTVMTDVLQFSPQQVDRMESERATDALLAPLAMNGAPVGGTENG